MSSIIQTDVQTWLQANLVCPVDRRPLETEGNWLIGRDGRRYPIVEGIPVLLRGEVRQTAWWAQQSWEQAWAIAESRAMPPIPTRTEEDGTIDPWVQQIVAATCGNLYKPLVGRLSTYPIPDLRLPATASQRVFVDLGCNWGRWSIAAARKGYLAVGLDPSLEAVLAAQRVARQLGLSIAFIVADARYIPLRNSCADIVFSYSVIQHFSKEDAKEAIKEAGRIVAPMGEVLVQMPNRYGIRSTYNLARRKFSEGQDFDVRYWTPTELIQTFASAISGTPTLSVDGFFGLGIQASDRDLMPAFHRLVISASERLRAIADHWTPLVKFADSLYVHTTKSSDQA